MPTSLSTAASFALLSVSLIWHAQPLLATLVGCAVSARWLLSSNVFGFKAPDHLLWSFHFPWDMPFRTSVTIVPVRQLPTEALK